MSDEPALHLRSSVNGRCERTATGRFLVHTECGLIVDASTVDNETATCPRCNRIDAEIVEREARP